ncbi:hypothetical protein FRC09_014366 [Ceratobasidium sp. 395]|nr:hypothetical protein FRC09_014366 [Ceratobasidium sp. 395]
MLAPLFAMMVDSRVKDGPPSPAWEYTGYAGLDATLSMLVNFFLSSFENGRFAMMPEFIASVGPAIVVPTIEMRRSGYRAPVVSAFMLALGYLYQSCGGAGLILPLWWAAFLLLSGGETALLRPAYARATLVGYFLGYVAPSMAMTVYQTPGAIAIWQFFPAHVLLTQALALIIQFPLAGKDFGSSHKALQTIHTFNFAWSAVTHAYTLFQASTSASPLDSLMDSYVPSYSSAPVRFVEAVSQAFCKWDHVYITATTLFVGLWYLRGAHQRLLAFGSFVLGSLLFGTGAGLSGVWMYREKQLEKSEKAPTARLKQS